MVVVYHILCGLCLFFVDKFPNWSSFPGLFMK